MVGNAPDERMGQQALHRYVQDERFSKRYGYWHPLTDEVVDRKSLYLAVSFEEELFRWPR